MPALCYKRTGVRDGPMWDHGVRNDGVFASNRLARLRDSVDAYFNAGNALNASPGRAAQFLGLPGACLAGRPRRDVPPRTGATRTAARRLTQ